MPDNLWKKSADPDARKKAYDKYQQSQARKEMNTKSTQKQSLLDKYRKGGYRKGGK